MSSHADTIRECDAAVLAQWRAKGLDYAADVVEAYQTENHLLLDRIDRLRERVVAENQRLRDTATACLLQWAQGRGLPPRLTSEEVALRDALGLDMEIFGDAHRRSLGPFASEALAGDGE